MRQEMPRDRASELDRLTACGSAMAGAQGIGGADAQQHMGVGNVERTVAAPGGSTRVTALWGQIEIFTDRATRGIDAIDAAGTAVLRRVGAAIGGHPQRAVAKGDTLRHVSVV